MATFNYPSSQRTAQRLIEKFGAKGIIRRKSKSGDAWNPALTTVDYHVSMARLNYAQSNIDGTLVKTGDLQFYIQAIGLDISPTTTDYIIFAGEIGTIVDVVTMSPSGTNIYYKIQARGFTKMAEETANNYVPLTRKIIAGNGLTGGGVLNKDITISLSQTSLDALEAAQNGGGGQGEKGDDGLSAYQIAVNNGFVGSQEQWLASLKGDKGEQGLKGDTGLQGPQGETGPAGQDGKNGADGQQGPAGKDGADGADGKSAYQIAVDKGYQGTESEWLASLKGESGASGGSSGGGLTESQLIELGVGKRYTGSAANLSDLIIPINELDGSRKVEIDLYNVNLSKDGVFRITVSNTDENTFINTGYYLSGFSNIPIYPYFSGLQNSNTEGFLYCSSYSSVFSQFRLYITKHNNSLSIEVRTTGLLSYTTPITYNVVGTINIANAKFIKLHTDSKASINCQYTKKEYL